jgi:hypothetical protein
MTRVTRAALVATQFTVPVLVERASAHHGAGQYDPRKNIELEGKLTKLAFVNPPRMFTSMSSVLTVRPPRWRSNPSMR